MPRKPRVDRPGQFHHVMNRGVGRRPIFERPDDFRFFKTVLACAVRSVRIRVHGYALMPNHYHLLVESQDGFLGETMRRIQALHAGRFNRTRDTPRPGHLFGARFKSFPISGQSDLFTVAGYIDRNPVKAGLCARTWEYPHGSAHRLLARSRKPPWICRETMDRILAPLLSEGLSRVAAYRSLYAGTDSLAAMDVVEDCLAGPMPAAPLDLDGLLGGNHARRRAWLERQALRADGTRISTPVVHSRNVQHAVQSRRSNAPDALIGPCFRSSLWDVVEVGLLRDLAGVGFRSIGVLIGTSTSTAANRHALHCTGLGDDPEYSNVAATIARDALEQCYGARATAIAKQVVERRLSRQVEESS